MQLFTDRKKLEELENTIKDQELIIFNLRSEIRTLVQKNKELEKNNKLLEAILESKNITQNENNKLINHIKYLEKQLDSYNPNLKPRKQEIKQCDIDLIKKMYSQNYTYREIKSKTGWSLNTISKVINKFYD
ncbi:MAG: hypothetical protein E6X43_12540 [Peptostreptococcaceae bacterium]|nr:hypothetical protein [Peptostreptococcaceae bacterium]